jgi:hypothetical protein
MGQPVNVLDDHAIAVEENGAGQLGWARHRGAFFLPARPKGR